MSDECQCIKCRSARHKNCKNLLGVLSDPSFRFACEICGNKRCPHHSDHTLDCTNSNESGQPGSVFVFSSLSREPRDE